jgi:hypothetical protein
MHRCFYDLAKYDSGRLRGACNQVACVHPAIAWYDNPRRQVHEESDPGTDRDAQPKYAHQDHIDPKVSGEPGADTSNLLITLIQHQEPRTFRIQVQFNSVTAAGTVPIAFAKLEAAFCAVHWLSLLLSTKPLG